MEEQVSRLVSKYERMRRKAYKVATDIGLSDEERHELAEILLRRDVTTWKHLEEEQLQRLLDAMEGYELIAHLKTMGAAL